MKLTSGRLALSAIAGVTLSTLGYAADASRETVHSVFVMTNDAGSNEVVSYERNSYGTLFSPRKFKTEGRGSGGKVDPLASQGSLTLSQDKHWLFAVNAGSGTLSVFRVNGPELLLAGKVPSGGAEPTSVAQHGNLIYVLNAAGSSSVVGFDFHDGHLTQIPDSIMYLSANGANPGSVAFSPDGKWLLAVEKTSNNIDVFSVFPNGTLDSIKVNPSAAPGAFAAIVAPNGTALVSATGSGGNTSAVSSYRIHSDGSLAAISGETPTLGAANCWNAVTPDGRFVYVSNSGSSTLSGFALSRSGTLTPIPGTVVGTNPSGSTNLDIAISSDGRFLYSVNAGTGTISTFAINGSDGSLTNLGTVGGLPAGGSLNGIAAD